MKPGEKLTHTTAGVFRLPMKPGTGPIHIKQFRVDHDQKAKIQKTLLELESHGVIERSFSPYNFPVFLRPKPELDENGQPKTRMCVDFSKLNHHCVPYFYPLPLIDEIQESFAGNPYLLKLDMQFGFHQILVAPEDREKLAFSFDGVHWQFRKVPFGLSTIPGFFQAMMNNILAGLVGKICLVYVDDIIITAKTVEQLAERLGTVLERLCTYNFKLNAQKCKFACREIRCLGYLCSAEGIRPDPERIEKAKNFPAPSTKKKLHQWLGLANYYRKFISHFADITEEQYNLLRKYVPYSWTEGCQDSFEKIKTALTSEPVMLMHPDMTKPFDVHCDASAFALGAILEQESRVVSYASRTLTPVERRYPVTDTEQLAVVFAVEKWRHFLTTLPFRVFTDHRPLAGELRKRSQSSRLMRYKLRLSEFNFEVIYKKGKENTNADALSRLEEEGELEPQDELIMVIMIITRSKAREMELEAELLKAVVDKQKVVHTELPTSSQDMQQEKVPDCYITENVVDITDSEDKNKILELYHDSSFGGHFGVNKTYARIRRKYFWPKMKNEIQEYINATSTHFY